MFIFLALLLVAGEIAEAIGIGVAHSSISLPLQHIGNEAEKSMVLRMFREFRERKRHRPASFLQSGRRRRVSLGSATLLPLSSQGTMETL